MCGPNIESLALWSKSPVKEGPWSLAEHGVEVVFACGLKLVSQQDSLTESLWNACMCRLFVWVWWWGRWWWKQISKNIWQAGSKFAKEIYVVSLGALDTETEWQPFSNQFRKSFLEEHIHIHIQTISKKKNDLFWASQIYSFGVLG